MPTGTPAHGGEIVSYRGYRFAVPAGWAVVSLAARPHACVRFDRHVIYLGAPGASEDCPARVIGATGAVLVQPGPRSARARSVENPVAHQISAVSPRIMVTAAYGGDRVQVRRILASASLPAPVRKMPRPAAVPSPAVARAVASAAGPAASDFTGKGFDACTAPSSSYMSAWLASPYRAVGIYIGGSDRGCSQPNLTAGWVSQQESAGWHFIPLYVGPQAEFGQLTNPSSQGTSAADDAITQAQALGLGLGTPIYYDMEAYPSGDSGAVLSFLSAWTSELHAHGYESGVYSSGGSGVTDLVNHYSSMPIPDVINDADWTGVDSTNDAYLPAADWAHHQRIVQYQGGHNETYGGDTINIDNDAIDVLLPYGGTRQASQAAAQSNGTVDVFYRGANGELEHLFYDPSSGAWSAPVSMGTEGVIGEPSVTTSTPGTVDVFFQGANGHLWHAVYTPSGGWSSEQDMNMGTLGGPPEAVAQQNGTIDVFWQGTGTTPAMWHAWYNPGSTWAGPQNLGGSLASAPAPVASSPGTVDVFFKGTDGTLWHVFFTPGSGWSGAVSLNMGTLGGAPHATGQLDGTIDVFWQGTGATPAMWHAWYNSGEPWAGPQSLGGSLASGPFGVSSSPGVVDVFFKGANGTLWHVFYRPASGWNPAASLNMGTLGGGPWASAEPTGTIDVFWKGSGTSPALWHAWYNSGKPWAGPQDLGGDVS